MLAILEDAIACFQKYAFAREGKGKAFFNEAEEWIQQGSAGGIFSFDSVCEVLGLNPSYLRQGLTAWKKNALVARSPATVYRLPASARKQKRPARVSRVAQRRLRRAAGR
jgi:hypothetical protein